MNYWRDLKFEDKPWIPDLRNLFKSLMRKKKYKYDCQFDWIQIKLQKTIKVAGSRHESQIIIEKLKRKDKDLEKKYKTISN